MNIDRESLKRILADVAGRTPDFLILESGFDELATIAMEMLQRLGVSDPARLSTIAAGLIMACRCGFQACREQHH